MNATRKGSTRVSGMEQAIAETHARLTAGGSAKELQRRALAAVGPALTTEKDGRLFAIATLERVQKASADEACAYPFGDDASARYRTLPQWDGLQKDLFKIFHEGTEAAQLGFCSIVTDALAEDIGKNIDAYRELEGEGKFLPWGALGTEYKAPKGKAKTKAQRKAKQKAHGPRLVKGEAEAIEQFLQHSGPTRKAAMKLLSKPYAEMVKAIRTDDKAADSLAALLVDLEEVKENYLTIALHITRAASDIKRANVEADEADAKRQRAK